ncbi:MAG: 30S ribosomal protein S6, partial [Deltaproteobacteria bacterium]|nr:30S ribosomal protein S6 [Deltaproteobacteria bacterium]
MALQSQRDEPGTLREYETIYVIRPDAEGEQIRHVNERVQRVIADAEGKLLRVENWGKRKLAYEIKKNTKGIYLYWRFLAGPQLIFELERNLRMLDTVLRYMTVKIDEDIDPNARPSDVTDEILEAASETAPDEEDLFLRMGRSGDEGGATADGAKPAEAAAADGAKPDGAKPAEAAAAEAAVADGAKPAE